MKVVIGDIHGCYDELRDLLNKISPSSGDEIITVGDFLDRGKKNMEVFRLIGENPRFSTLKGNHERKHLLISDGKCKPSLSQLVTREEFNGEYRDLLKFLRTLPAYMDLDEATLVHGAMEPGVPLEEQKETFLVSSMSAEKRMRHLVRPWYELVNTNKPIIFGHRTYEQPFVFRDKIFGIDTGCCTGGSLTAITLPDFKFHSVKARDTYWPRDLGSNELSNILNSSQDEGLWSEYCMSKQKDLDGEACYDKATSMFTEKVRLGSTTMTDVDKIITLYNQSLEEKPDFADAHLMIAYAYVEKASLLIKEFKRTPSKEIRNKALSCLDDAEQNFKDAMKYNPKFTRAAKEDLEIVQTKRRTIDGFSRAYLN